MDHRYIISALAGLLVLATILATITTVRYISHQAQITTRR
jgi:hypothetical protein